MTKALKAPIKYFGGKGMMVKQIKQYFPEEGAFNTYIEPFGGSFALGLTVDCPNMIYNDLDKNVYSLYKVISDKTLFNQFKEKCDLAFYSEDLRYEFRQKLKDPILSVLDRAFYFFYVNRTSHNGIGGMSVNTVVRRNMSKSVSDFLSCIDRLPELHNALSKVIILNQDGIKLLERYDKEGAFYYCDSPYHHSTRTETRYAVDMSDEDQERYINTLLSIEKAKILVSGYDCELYQRLVDNGWKKFDFEINTVDGNKVPKTKIESVWKFGY